MMRDTIQRMRAILSRLQGEQVDLEHADSGLLGPAVKARVDKLAAEVVEIADLTDQLYVKEQALEVLEQYLETVVAQAFSAIITTADDGEILSWNAAAASFFGWTAEEAIGQKVGTLIVPPRYRVLHEQGLARARVHPRAPGTILYRVIRAPVIGRAGNEFYVHMTIAPTYTVAGQLRYLAVLLDPEAQRAVVDLEELIRQREDAPGA
jgi:PAS domain S-box-containing protein